jgi:hypothetical protein
MKKITGLLILFVFSFAMITGCDMIGKNQEERISGVIQSGGRIYYTQNDTLYRMKPDWTEKTKVIEHFAAESWAIQGDTIYYGDRNTGNLSRIKTDGTEKMKLNSDPIFGFEVSGDWIYFSVKPGSIYKIKTDGTEKTKLADISSFKGVMRVSGDSIFYMEGINLMKMVADGAGVVKLTENVEINAAKGDWVYYSELNKEGKYLNLSRMKADGTEKVKLTDGTFAAIDGEWLYYDKDNGLYRSSLNGAGETKLNDIDMWNLIGIWGDYIYYSEYSGSVYRVNMDDSNKIELK